MAEQLELFAQRIAAPRRSKNTVMSGCATEISLANLAELENMETKLNDTSDAMIDFNFPDRMIDEERKLDEELDALRGQVRQEQAYNHRENQAHQHKVRKLQQRLHTIRQADTSRKRAWESEVAMIEVKLRLEKDDLTRQLEQMRKLNELLKQKLDPHEIIESKESTRMLKADVCKLGLAMRKEETKGRLLAEVESLRKLVAAFRASASERAEMMNLMKRQRQALLHAQEDAKEFVRALRCKYMVAKTKLQDMTGVPRTMTTFRKPGTTRGVASSTSDARFVKPPVAFFCSAFHFQVDKWNARLAQKALSHSFL